MKRVIWILRAMIESPYRNSPATKTRGITLFKNYLYGGLFSILSAAITLPVTILMFLSFLSDDESLSNWNAMLVAFQSVVFVVVMLYLREFVRERLNTGNLLWLFSSIIVLGLAINILTLLLDMNQILSMLYLMIAILVLYIPLGVLLIILSQRILKSNTASVAYSKPTGHAVATTGILMATVFFAEFAIISSLFMDVFLALMFFSNRMPAGQPGITASAT
jgi:hypothetical protein